MIRRHAVVAALCALTLLSARAMAAEAEAGAQTAEAEAGAQTAEKPAEPEFLRLARDKGKSPMALEAAIVRYVPSDPQKKEPVVDLVSAVHIAEKGYYRTLNREFRGYDAVLYELVAPKGTRVPKGGTESRHPVSMLQHFMGDVLELTFQLDEVDYRRKNMVHADMSPEQFAKSMQDRGESMFGMFLRMMGYATAQQNKNATTDAQLLMALFDKNRALALKRVMAEQFQDMEGSLLAINGPEGSTIISERNKVALDELRKQIKDGKKKLAVFYGAGHMPDFQKRLVDDFGLKRENTRWLVAWDLKSKPSGEPKPTEDSKPADESKPRDESKQPEASESPTDDDKQSEEAPAKGEKAEAAGVGTW